MFDLKKFPTSFSLKTAVPNVTSNLKILKDAANSFKKASNSSIYYILKIYILKKIFVIFIYDKTVSAVTRYLGLKISTALNSGVYLPLFWNNSQLVLDLSSVQCYFEMGA